MLNENTLDVLDIKGKKGDFSRQYISNNLLNNKNIF